MWAASEIFQIRLRTLLVTMRSRRPRAPLHLEETMSSPCDRPRDNALGLPMRCDVLTTLQKLPEMCLTRSKTTGAVIAIRRGELEYYPTHTTLTPEQFNAPRGISPEQVEAMENGSIFGWEVPDADPDIVRERRRGRD